MLNQSEDISFAADIKHSAEPFEFLESRWVIYDMSDLSCFQHDQWFSWA